MNDRLALLMFQPKFIAMLIGHDAIEYIVMILLLFPCTFCAITHSDDSSFLVHILLLSYRLQLLYYEDITRNAEPFKKVINERGEQINCKLCLTKNRLEKMISLTVSIIHIWKKYPNVNTFCFTSNTCECDFANAKKHCDHDETPQRMETEAVNAAYKRAIGNV